MEYFLRQLRVNSVNVENVCGITRSRETLPQALSNQNQPVKTPYMYQSSKYNQTKTQDSLMQFFSFKESWHKFRRKLFQAYYPGTTDLYWTQNSQRWLTKNVKLTLICLLITQFFCFSCIKSVNTVLIFCYKETIRL